MIDLDETDKEREREWVWRYAAGNSLGYTLLAYLALPCQRASSIRPTAYASLGYAGLRPRSGYAPFGIGAARREIRSGTLLTCSSLALSICVVYSPNSLRCARLCRPSASIRVGTANIGAARGKFARSRRSDLDAPFALKTRSFFRPTPPRQYLWLHT